MKKRIVIAALLALSLLLTAVSAAEMVNYDIVGDDIIALTQTLPSGKANAVVSILVYHAGKNYQDLTPATALQTVAEANQTLSGPNGVYSFTFQVDGGSGFYDVVVGSDAGDVQRFQILYSKPAEAEGVLEQLNDAPDSQTFFQILYGESENESPGWQKLGFYVALSEQPTDQEVSKLLYEWVQQEKFDAGNTAEAVARFRKMYVLALLNQGKTADLAEMERFLGLANETFYTYYDKDYFTSDVRQQVFEDLQNRDLTTVADYEAAMLEQVVLKTVQYADGYGRIRDVLQAFSDETGIDTAKLSSKEYLNVLGHCYTGYDTLRVALLDNSAEQRPSRPSTGGGGGWNSGIVVDKELANIPNPVPVKIAAFDDLDSVNWAQEAIEFLADKGVVAGKEQKMFYPLDQITREEFVTILVRSFDLDGGPAEIEFQDVEPKAWYEPYVRAAVAAGIVQGQGDGTFGVGQKITRQDMAVMVARAKALVDAVESETPFSDDAEIADYAKDAVYQMRALNIINGYEDGSFQPASLSTRAEAAVIIYRAVY